MRRNIHIKFHQWRIWNSGPGIGGGGGAEEEANIPNGWGLGAGLTAPRWGTGGKTRWGFHGAQKANLYGK